MSTWGSAPPRPRLDVPCVIICKDSAKGYATSGPRAKACWRSMRDPHGTVRSLVAEPTLSTRLPSFRVGTGSQGITNLLSGMLSHSPGVRSGPKSRVGEGWVRIWHMKSGMITQWSHLTSDAEREFAISPRHTSLVLGR
jgi:hypothetical protein